MRNYGIKHRWKEKYGMMLFKNYSRIKTKKQELKDHMRGANQDLNVVHVDILLEGNGRSKGCALVGVVVCLFVFVIFILVYI